MARSKTTLRSPRRGITLVGAFHPDLAPLDQRRLAVVFEPEFDIVGVFTGSFSSVAFVDAEGLAEHAIAEARISVHRGGIDSRFSFRSREGVPHAVVLAQRFGRPTLRALTELSGFITTLDDSRIGPARLRFGWRVQ